MGIASKLSAAMFLVFAGSAVANYAVLSATLQPMFDAIERDIAHKTQEHVSGEIDALRQRVVLTAEILGRRAERPKSASSALSGILGDTGVNILILRDNDANVIWGDVSGPTASTSLDGLALEVERSIGRIPIEGGGSRSGFMKTSKGAVLAAVSPLVSREPPYAAAGTVIAATLVEPGSIHQGIATLFDFSAGPRTPASREVISKPEAIETAIPLSDMHGRTVGRLLTYSPRTISKTGSTAIQTAALIMLVSAAMAVAALWLFLHSSIVSRLTALRQHLATAGHSSEIAPFRSDETPDEIGDLSRSFNRMALQANHLRDAIADSCYLSGMSQWAATTLHNLRNGMSPISAVLWQLERIYDAEWLDNIERSLKLHNSGTTCPDQRKMLNAYLIENISRLLEASKKTRDFTHRMERTHIAMVQQVSSFESYTRNESELEPIELLPVLKDASEAATNSGKESLEFLLPARPAVVNASRILLRQIMFNLFAHARDEAFKSPHGSRNVQVTIVDEDCETSALELRISFSGRRLSPVEIRNAFGLQVPITSAKNRSLGLHWCANALQQIGGSMQLANTGAGNDITMIISLQRHQQKLREAA